MVVHEFVQILALVTNNICLRQRQGQKLSYYSDDAEKLSKSRMPAKLTIIYFGVSRVLPPQFENTSYFVNESRHVFLKYC